MATSLQTAAPHTPGERTRAIQRVLISLPALLAVVILVSAAWMGWRYEHPSKPVACPAGWRSVTPAAGPASSPADLLAWWVTVQPGQPSTANWRPARAPRGAHRATAAFVNTTYRPGSTGLGARAVLIGRIRIAASEVTTPPPTTILAVIAVC